MRLDPNAVRQHIENLKLLFPEIADDEDAWSMTIESETDFLEVMEKIANVMRESASMAGGIAGRIAELELRQQRFVRREQAMRALAFRLIQTAEVRKVELHEVTLFIAAGKPKVVITNEAELPPFCTRTKVEADKAAIKSLLDAGQEVPGACLSNAEPHLVVKTK